MTVMLALSVSGFSPTSYSEDEGDASWWMQFSASGRNLLFDSIDSLSEAFNSVDANLTTEMEELESSGFVAPKVREKIESISAVLEEYAELKSAQSRAWSFTLISSSKKDYQIEIDEVLLDIEEVLFDGEIINYASKTRKARALISSLEDKKASLNEDLVFAPEEARFLEKSKQEVMRDIQELNQLIKRSEQLIVALESDLQQKLAKLGVSLTREQIRVMTTRADGDELARGFAIFDITRQISEVLQQLLVENSFSGKTTVRYYGVYVIMSEILGFSQRTYIEKIEQSYLPALDAINDDVEDSIEYAEAQISVSENSVNIELLKNNISANEFTKRVLDEYRLILRHQRDSLTSALDATNEQIAVAYSTYDTAVNSANLVGLINEAQKNFDDLMQMQIPPVIPFENLELEMKFRQISDQISPSSG